MNKLSILFNGKPLFESESLQQASEFLYILNKYELLNKEVTPVTTTPLKAPKSLKVKPKKITGGKLTDTQKDVIRQMTVEGAALKDIVTLINPKDKHERDRVYAFSYGLRKKKKAGENIFPVAHENRVSGNEFVVTASSENRAVDSINTAQ